MCERGLTVRLVELVGYTQIQWALSKIQLGPKKTKLLYLKAKTESQRLPPWLHDGALVFWRESRESWGPEGLRTTGAELRRRSRSQTRQICYAEVRVLDGGGWRGVTSAHGQDIWIDVHENREFPDSPWTHRACLREGPPFLFKSSPSPGLLTRSVATVQSQRNPALARTWWGREGTRSPRAGGWAGAEAGGCVWMLWALDEG